MELQECVMIEGRKCKVQRIRRLDKLPKRKVTVDDILELSDIQETFDVALTDRDRIEGLLIIWTTEGETHRAWYNLTKARQLWLLERIRHDLMIEADGTAGK